MSAFLAARRSGSYWKSLKKCLSIVDRLSLDINATDERKYEDRIAGALQPNFEDFVDQRNRRQTVTRVTIFAHDHRPDMSIYEDGVAVEVKVIRDGQSFRQAIGQALLYRMGYRFVVIVWIDTTSQKEYKSLITEKGSSEARFIKELEDYNIFCCIK